MSTTRPAKSPPPTSHRRASRETAAAPDARRLTPPGVRSIGQPVVTGSADPHPLARALRRLSSGGNQANGQPHHDHPADPDDAHQHAVPPSAMAARNSRRSTRAAGRRSPIATPAPSGPSPPVAPIRTRRADDRGDHAADTPRASYAQRRAGGVVVWNEIATPEARLDSLLHPNGRGVVAPARDYGGRDGEVREGCEQDRGVRDAAT